MLPRSNSSIRCTEAGVEVKLAMTYSTLPKTRECTLDAASFCCRPLAAFELYPVQLACKP